MAKQQLTIPAGWQARLESSHRKFCRDIAGVDAGVCNPAFLDEYDHIHRMLGADLPRDARILEIGSGFGTGLANLLLNDLDAVGVEPGSGAGFEGRHDMAQELLQANHLDPARVFQGVGESLPFPDCSFEVVVSSAVLEHVQDVTACVREALRVLKPGGFALFDLPNYHAWWETHYRLPWLPVFPYLPKAVVKAWVQAFGRKDYYVDEMRLITPGTFRSISRNLATPHRLELVLFLIQPLRRFRPTDWMQWKYYVYRHTRKKTPWMRANELLLGTAMKLFEITGCCGGFRVKLTRR
jgi:SAM-dependent methyltransferase